ncbi:MAG: CoA transferase [Chloroflexi bacterium]|nr:CoA transferase [Chloroflexota bacterium]
MENQAPSGPLYGIRVLDLAGPPGQYCTKLLAQLGAGVIKVEPPAGDPGRRLPPFFHNSVDPQKSLHWFYYNTNKRSITLDLTTSEGVSKLKYLAARSDILVETQRPGLMEEAGLGYADLRRVNSRLIYVSVTPFGQTGPWREFKSCDLVASALGGLLYVCGWPDRAPVRMAGDQSLHLASLHGLAAALIALYQRQFTGLGQHVDVSMHECVPATLMSTIPSYVETGEISKRKGNDRTLAANGLFPCADGFVDVRLRNHRWGDFVAWLDSENMAGDLAEDKWKDPWYRIEPDSLKHIDAAVANFMRSKRRQELYDGGVKRGLEVAPINTAADIAHDPQLIARNFFVDVWHEELHTALPYMRSVLKLSETPVVAPARAPLIGEHNDEILKNGDQPAQVTSPAEKRAEPVGSSDTFSLPFTGLRVLEFTSAVAGPYVGKVLADYGARVIVVESRATRKTGGMAREPGPRASDRTSLNLGHLYNKVATNKMSVNINMTKPKGFELFKKLVVVTDVIIVIFAPRVLERWGLTYDQLTRIKPDIIMVRLPTVATSGPYKNQTSSSWNLLAMSGLNYMSGYPDRLPVSACRYSYPDESSSPFHPLAALLAALYWKTKTGRGQYVEASQYEGILALAGPGILEYMVNGQLPGRQVNRCPGAAPHGVYRCLGEDRWCAIAAFSEDEWGRLCMALGQPDLDKSPEFGSLAERLKHEDALDRVIESWTSQRTAEEVMGILQAAGIAAGVVQDVNDLLNKDPQLRARRYWKEVAHPEAGKLIGAGWGFKLSLAPEPLNGRPPLFGEHTDHVAGSILGIPEGEINDLIVNGILY